MGTVNKPPDGGKLSWVYSWRLIWGLVIFMSLILVVSLAVGSSLSDGGRTSSDTAEREPRGPAKTSPSPSFVGPSWAEPTPDLSEYSGDLAPYIAVVTGYGSDDEQSAGDLRVIQLSWTRRYLDGDQILEEPALEEVTLARVMPFDPATCGGRDPDALRRAREALVAALPIGSRVLSVRAGAGATGDERFLHVLAGSSDSPSPSPPAGSVNEALVATGTWVPDRDSYYFDDRPYDAASVLIVGPEFRAPKPVKQYDPGAVFFDDEDYGREYSDRILAAANAALTETVSGTKCRTAYRAFVQQEVRDAKKRDREYREWRARQERLLQDSGGCRDGDGDGVCFER